jgi:cytochrome b pre-mRNA-processing protein 3
MLKRLIAKSPGKAAGERLCAAATAYARNPAFYLRMGAPDTVEGRFELLTLHVVLLIDRLGAAPGPAADARQRLFDAYVSNLDGALREMGVGDLSVGKRMKRLGEAFYGRAQAYDDAFRVLPDTTALRDLIVRTALRDTPGADPALLTDYVIRCRESLARAALDEILSGEPAWAAP